MSTTGSPSDNGALQLPTIPLLVFTDLDGTLLDHDDYRYDAALPALQRLAKLHVPVIPTTSKTLTEVRELQQALHNPHPCIVENGGALCIPQGYFDAAAGNDTPSAAASPYQVEHLGPAYDAVIHTLRSLRADHGWRFSGFADMSVNDVAQQTGLSAADASRARQRLCSEPLLWQDTDAALKDFSIALQHHGLTLTRGGRFWHVMGQTSKAIALHKLCELYRQAGLEQAISVACGDSPNDEAMLASADIAVVVRRKDGQWLDVAGREQTLKTDAPGPAGWNAALQQILDALDQPTFAPTEA